MLRKFAFLALFLVSFILSWIDSLFFWPWLLPVFLFLVWRKAREVKKIYWLAFFAGLWRDLFLGNHLGKSAFIFILLLVLLRFLDARNKAGRFG